MTEYSVSFSMDKHNFLSSPEFIFLQGFPENVQLIFQDILTFHAGSGFQQFIAVKIDFDDVADNLFLGTAAYGVGLGYLLFLNRFL